MNVIEKCPVCGKNGITTPLEKCPQCDSDLECFRLLNSLSESSGSSPEKKNEHNEATLSELKRIVESFNRFQNAYENSKKSSLKWRTLMILGLIGILILYHSFYVTGLVENTDSLAVALQAIQMTTKKQEINQQKIIENLDSIKVAIVSAGDSGLENSVSFHTYTLKEKETIWDVAKHFYGNSIYYPILLEHNPDLNIYVNLSSPTIRILENVHNVDSIYDRLIHTQSGQKLFKYKCRENDTWESLSLRFYGHTYGTGVIRKFNLGQGNLTPESEINIPLKD